MSGIYVHVPFCKSKCIYCDFYSIAVQSLIPDYIEAIKKEIVLRKNQLNDKNISTIYFGGGTPSILSIAQTDEIFSTIRQNYNITKNAEITFEANPENLDREYLSQLRKIGINRLSIGIQSFDNEILKFLKRRHTAEKAIECVNSANELGFNDISIDLIYGIDGLSNKMWEQELEIATSLPITHISCYCLGIENGTLLNRYLNEGKYSPKDDENCLQQFLIFDKKVTEKGFEHYEISNAGKPNFHSKHNSSYWDRTEYLGFGPAAHSYYTNTRSWNFADLKTYCKGLQDNSNAISESEILSPDEIYEETIMLGLRTSEGINLDNISKIFGSEKANFLRKRISNLQAELFNFDGKHFSLTAKGMFVSDKIIIEVI